MVYVCPFSQNNGHRNPVPGVNGGHYSSLWACSQGYGKPDSMGFELRGMLRILVGPIILIASERLYCEETTTRMTAKPEIPDYRTTRN